MNLHQIPPLAHRLQNQEKIKKLEQQVQALQEQNKTILEHLVELSQVIASQLK